MSSSCPSCHAPLALSAQFCPFCGTRLGAPSPSLPSSSSESTEGTLDLCSSCGALSHPGRETCGMCGTAWTPSAVRAPRSNPDGTYWVAVRCSFSCRACGHTSPLDLLDADGSIECLRCGTEQKFQVRQWRSLVAHAHAVGDLAGPSPEGREPSSVSLGEENPYAEIGRSKQYAELGVGETDQKKHHLRLRAAPGHPLSSRGAPLEIASRTEHTLTLRAPEDGTTTTYSMPAVARDFGLEGVVAEQHVEGRKSARMSDGPGAVALACPTCSAPLAATTTGSLVSCSYCGTTSLIPTGARRRLGAGDLAPTVWWMLLSGRSRERTSLERQIHQQTQKETKRKAAAEQRSKNVASNQSRRDAQRREKGRGGQQRLKTALLVGFGLTGALGALALVSFIRQGNASNPSAARTPTAAPVPPPPPAAPAAVAPFDLVWEARVKKAEGKDLAPGTACQLSMTTNTKKISRFVIVCAGDTIYDLSQAPGSGMTNLGWAFVEAVGKEEGTFQYGVGLNDIGQRTGRPQLQLNSSSHEARITQQNLPSYEVSLDVDVLSMPISGSPAIFPPSVDLTRQQHEVRVDEAEGPAGVQVGDACELEYYVSTKLQDGYRCYVSVRCGDAWLYPAKEGAGFVACQLDGQGRPLSATDLDPTSKDGDPQVELTPSTHRGVYRDSKRGKDVRVAFRWE